MSITTQIIIAGLIVILIGYPLVVAFDKWKKEEAEDKKEKDGEDDVQD